MQNIICSKHTRYGFTLLELSIVLVIIGLIVGGLTVGQELIRQSELNTVVRQHEEITTAVNTYQLKYGTLPGDHNKAVQYWGRADGGTDLTQNCAAPETNTVAGSKATCNGDGDKRIDDDTHEAFRFWQHMSNADIFQGSFSGVKFGANPESSRVGVNIPGGKIEGSGWYANWEGNNSGSGSEFVGQYGHQMVLGNAGDVTDDPDDPVATPAEVGQVDEKIDDGRPATGKLLVRYWANCTSATANNQLTATYDYAEPGKLCSFIFINQFN